MFRGENGTVVLEAVWRNGLKWHDGVVFDARDLDFTIQCMKNPAIKSPFADLASDVVSITSLDRGKRTRMVFARDSRQLLELLTLGILPSHLLKDAPMEKGKENADIASDSISWEEYAEKPVGLGPYRVSRREKGSYMLLEPHADFYDTSVASRSRILVRSFLDYQQLLTDFRAGKYDWINLPSMLAEQLETMRLEKVRFIRYPNPAALMWIFNNRRPVLADARVRKALDLLVNRDKIKNVMPSDGVGVFVSPLASASYMPEEYSGRFAEAVRLLDEAGVKDQNNDGLRDLAGKTFVFEILVNDDNITRRVVGDRIIEDLAAAGIKGEIKSVSWAEFIAGKLRGGDFDSALVSYSLPVAGNWVAMLHSAGTTDSLNFAGVNDASIDAALEKLDSMFADADNTKARADVAGFLDDNRPVAFLFKPYDVGLYHAESGSSTAARPIWDDVLDWRVMFGSPDSQL